MREYVSLDLETTGLEPKKDRIIEIGAVKIRDGQIQETHATLVDPQTKIPERITELTGISSRMVEGKPFGQEAVKGLLDFCGELPLLGHNIMFDYSFVKHSAVNMGMDFEKKGMDTLKLARNLLPDLESKSLQNLRQYYHLPQEEAHRALEDALTTFRLYERLREEFEEKNPAFLPSGTDLQSEAPGPYYSGPKTLLAGFSKIS